MHRGPKTNCAGVATKSSTPKPNHPQVSAIAMTNSTSFVPLAPTIPGPAANARPPRLKFPPGACDCHAHIFGPQQQFPFAPGHGYVAPEASVDSYVKMLRTIGCERAVIVQPSVYGTDNRCTVDVPGRDTVRARTGRCSA
jgi:Amidohydrolase